MTPRCAISSVALVLLLFFEVGYPLALAEADQPTMKILDSCSFAIPTCNLHNKSQEPNMYLRNMKASLKHKLMLDVTVDLNETAKATDSASFLGSAHTGVHLMGNEGFQLRADICAWKNQFTVDHTHPPSWRLNVALISEEPVHLRGLECQCKAIVAPFNMLTFTCSEGQEKFTWTTTSAIVGYTCVKLK